MKKEVIEKLLLRNKGLNVTIKCILSSEIESRITSVCGLIQDIDISNNIVLLEYQYTNSDTETEIEDIYFDYVLNNVFEITIS